MRAFILAGTLALSGCDQVEQMIPLESISCKAIASMNISLPDSDLVSFDKSTVTEQSPERVVCHGTGFYRDGSEVPTRIKAFRNDNGEILVSYDSDEYQVEEQKKAQAEFERKVEADREALAQEYEDTITNLREQLM